MFGKKKDVSDNEAGNIIKQFQSVRDYKTSMGFEDNWKEYINFTEDRQWTRTEKNKNIPKPMHNIIKFSKRAKTSAVLAGNISVIFSPVEAVEDSDIARQASDMFNNAIVQTNEEIDQERLDYEVVGDAFTLGTGFSHYYWDSSIVGGYKAMYKGSIAGESLDPMNVFPGNPQCKNKDKQPFWIITYRDLVNVIKKEAKDNGVSADLIELITGDKDTSQESYDASNFEVSGEEKTTVYMKYWRDIDDNKIYFEKATKGCLFKPKTAQWDYDGTELEPYPIGYFDWEDRKKSIFGIGEVEGMIYNQKAINFISAMQILNVQDTGWSKYIVKYDALRQTMQNIPGEIIKDMSMQPGDNIKAMQPAQMSNQAFQVLDNVINNTRVFNGVSESITGESMGANMAASAIIALQNQAKVPLDNIRKKFFRYQKDVARIKEFFFKCKYNLPRTVTSTNNDGTQTSKSFTGTDYKGIPLSLKIDVGAGSTFSESLQMNVLDSMSARQWLSKYEYIKYIPDNIVPSDLKHDFAQQEEQMKANPPQPQPDKPGISISFESLPQDARVQILKQIGIQSDGGLSPSEQANIELKQSAMVQDHAKHMDNLNNKAMGGGQGGMS